MRALNIARGIIEKIYRKQRISIEKESRGIASSLIGTAEKTIALQYKQGIADSSTL